MKRASAGDVGAGGAEEGAQAFDAKQKRARFDPDAGGYNISSC